MIHSNNSFCTECYSSGHSTSSCLADILNSPMTLEDAALRTLRILDALEAHHRLCSLHLDICPKNIFLTGPDPNDPVVLAPCGHSCAPGHPCPKGYAAPELIRSSSDPADFSTDLYSVTAVFFHCLMGRRLALPEALQPKAPDAKQCPTLADVSAEVRRDVGKIFRKGLNVLPEKRYRSIGALRRALTELLEIQQQ